MTAYYNEHDPKAAAWLRELIKQNLIAPGEVDERSIEDVTPKDIRGFTQCHFFAGIGVWSRALRQAGWRDDRPVWTGSCPCQPFSAAGKRKKTDDERHLWPALEWLIRQCKPDTVFGEQVSSKDGLAWFDSVSTDLEGQGYTVGAIDSCAAGVGAPHIRQRLYWVADTDGEGWKRWDTSSSGRKIEFERPSFTRGMEYTAGDRRVKRRAEPIGRSITGGCGPRGMADTTQQSRGLSGQAGRENVEAFGSSEVSGMGNSGRERTGRDTGTIFEAEREARLRSVSDGAITTSPVNGYWRNAEWVYCRDEKYRAVEPGTFPLANGIAGRVGLLRGYGNAIVLPQAQMFIEIFMRTKL